MITPPLLPNDGKATSITLSCLITDFYPNKITITWEENGLQSNRGKQSEPVKIGRETYTAISQLDVPHQHWQNNSVYTCKATHNSIVRTDNISMCTVPRSSPRNAEVFLIGPSIQDISQGKQLTATCLVIGYNLQEFSITWKIDGKTPTKGIRTETTVNTNGTETMKSFLELTGNTWNQGKPVSCEVKHPCQQKLQNAEARKTDPRPPTVEVRRSLRDDLGADTAELECLLTGFFPSDIYVKWQVDNRDVPNDQYTNEPVTSDGGKTNFSMVSRIFIQRNKWPNLKSYKCVFNQGNGERKFPENDKVLTGLASAPTVKLLLSPSESQSEKSPLHLVCSASGFSPTIKWRSQDQPKRSTTERRARGSDGRFSVTSELEVPKSEWNRGDVFQCEVEDPFLLHTRKENISKCSVLQSSPRNAAVFLIGPSIQDISEGKQLTATCLVIGYNLQELSITWKIDGKTHTKGIRTETTVNTNNTETMKSFLELTGNTWNQGKPVSCEVKHPCQQMPQTAETRRTTDPRPPTVEVRRSLRDDLGADTAELECLLTGFFPSDIYVKWQVDNRDVPNDQYTNEPVTSDGGKTNFSMVSRIFIQRNKWPNLKSYKCVFNQGNGERKFPENDKVLTGLASAPTVKLLLSPSESQSEKSPLHLVCSASGFSPTIKWRSQDQPKRSTTERRARGSDGRFSVTSELEVPKSEWNRGDVFQCEVEDPFLLHTRKENISKCSVLQSSPRNAAVFLIGPSIQDISEGKQLTATCLVIGYNLHEFSITWKIDGKTPTKGIRTETTVNTNGTETMKSFLGLTGNTWNQGKPVSCEVKHPCLQKPQTAETRRTTDPRPPTVEVRRSLRDDLEADTAELECLLTGFFPRDIYVKWQVDNRDVPNDQYTNEPVTSDGGKTNFSMVSRIFIQKNKWPNLKSYKCVFNQGNGERKFPENDKVLTALIGTPTIKLLLSPSESFTKDNSQYLVCSVSGFSPTIKWHSQNQLKRSTTERRAMGSDGRFSVTSELEVPKSEWNRGDVFQCEVEDPFLLHTRKENISKCSVLQSSPRNAAVFLIGPSIQDISEGKQLTATCLVIGYNLHEFSITWKIDGKTPTKGIRTETTVNTNGTETMKSFLGLTGNTWNQGKPVSCEVKHPCLQKPQTAETRRTTDPRPPTVEVRRSLRDDLGADTAELECLLTGFFPRDIYVKWQVDNRDVPNDQYTNEPVTSDGGKTNFSMVSRIFIQRNKWPNLKSYKCVFNQGNGERKFPENDKVLTALIGTPTIKLLLSPSESFTKDNSQYLVCSVSGFSPTIKWHSQNQLKRSTTERRAMGSDGRFSVTSELEVPKSEWNRGDVFQCEVEDPFLLEVRKENISKCSVFRNTPVKAEVFISGPSFRESSQQKDLTVTCLVIGYNLKDFSISWTVSGSLSTRSGETQPVVNTNGTESMKSSLRVKAEEWNTYKEITCEVSHPCSDQTQKLQIAKFKDPRRPTIQIFEPSESDLQNSDKAILVCLVSGFFPAEIFVKWKLNGTELSTSLYTNSPATKDPQHNTYSMDSKLQIPKSEWYKGLYACDVSHESSSKPIVGSVDNVFASLISSPPKAKILRSSSELVCLVYDFSPKAIDITWLLNKDPAPQNHTNSEPARRSDGKFTSWSTLHIPDTEWAPGMVFTCKIVHEASKTHLLHNISKLDIIKEQDYFDETAHIFIPEDDVQQIWTTAYIFIILFLISFIYSSIVTMVKV
ncbi:uncharacterized protein [Lepisosteus oculatus]